MDRKSLYNDLSIIFNNFYRLRIVDLSYINYVNKSIKVKFYIKTKSINLYCGLDKYTNIIITVNSNNIIYLSFSLINTL